MRSFRDRMARLEALERDHDPYGRPVTAWSDEELAAYLTAAYREWPQLRTMSNADLEALCNEELS
jgi:hypothetical protein